MALRLETLPPDDNALTQTAARLICAEIYAGQIPVSEYIDGLHIGTTTAQALVENNSELVAVATTAHSAGQTHVANIVVRPELRGNGYGTMLMRCIAAQARERGDDEIRLFTECGSDEERFFLRLGFVPDNEEDDMYASPSTVLLGTSREQPDA